MSYPDKCPVLIDQNRNTIGAKFMCKKSSDSQYLTQCDGIPRPTHKQSVMKSPTQTISRPSSSDESVTPKTKEHSSDGADPVSSCLDINELADLEVQRKRVCLVKLYAWIKDEMTKTAAGTIANYLFESEHKLLSAAAHESIHRCKRRREAIERLLKKVLMGPASIYDVFIHAVKLQEDTYIADRLAAQNVSDEDIAVFVKLERSSLGKCQRPDHDLPRLTFSTSDQQTLHYHMYDKDIIEQVNDHFLSLLIFSVREHTNIVNCTIDEEKKAKALIETMCKCAEDIYKDFCRILVSIEEPHVVQKLEKKVCDSVQIKQRKKRKSTRAGNGDTEESESSSVKRPCLSSTVESSLVSSLRNSPSYLQQAVNSIGFDLKHINNGSIVIQVVPRNQDSWLQLKENCRTGRIKDFIPAVYRNEDIKELMEEGEYRIKFTIYTLPSFLQSESDKAMFHLETIQEDSKGKSLSKVSTDHHSNLLEENSDLLCEELEITKDLLAILKDRGLVSNNIKQELDKVGSRAKKIKFLLKKLGSHGNKGFEVIKDYVKEQNQDLFKSLVTREEVKSIDSKMDSVTTVTKTVEVPSGKHRAVYKKEVFFTATLVLLVEKKDGSESDCKGKHMVTCTDIIDPVCHFEGRGKENKGKSEQVTLVLEDAWIFNSKKAERKIAESASSGKRKNELEKDDCRKRASSIEQCDDSEEDDTNVDLVETKPELKKSTSNDNVKGKVCKEDKTKIQPEKSDDSEKDKSI